jgi:hypothetical protein
VKKLRLSSVEPGGVTRPVAFPGHKMYRQSTPQILNFVPFPTSHSSA